MTRASRGFNPNWKAGRITEASALASPDNVRQLLQRTSSYVVRVQVALSRRSSPRASCRRARIFAARFPSLIWTWSVGIGHGVHCRTLAPTDEAHPRSFESKDISKGDKSQTLQTPYGKGADTHRSVCYHA